MPTRFLRKDYEGAPVFIWTEVLAGHKGMVECDKNGKILCDAKAPELEKLPDQPFRDVPITKVVPIEEPQIKFQPEPDHAPAVPVDPVDKEVLQVQEHLDERSERILEIQAKLSSLTGSEIRKLVRDEFDGKKLPPGISKLSMVEHFIELDRARP